MVSKQSKGILEGVRIIDMTSVVFGPYATQTLADLGADVVKVEAPTGDAFRMSGKQVKTKGMSPGFMSLNRGKRSITLDLKKEKDQAVMTELLRTADMFIHNVRLNAVEKLGFAPEQVKEINKSLIYIHCVGFGSGGPYDGLQAYDDVIQAASGTATLAGRVDGSGKARYLPSLIADKVAGLHGAQAALAAYIHKLRTGESQFVEVPMFEAFTHFMLTEHLGGLTFDPPNAKVCYKRQIDPDRQPFPTADGFISIVPYTLKSWPEIFSAVGDPDFLKRNEIITPVDQYKKMHLMYQRLAEITPEKTTEDWVKILRAVPIPCIPVRDIADILDDPHLAETGFFQKQNHPSEGHWYSMTPPVRYSRISPKEPRHPPRLGEHNEEIRAEIVKNSES